MGRYTEPGKRRHRVELTDGVEQIRIPMRRNWFVVLFLLFWLGGWTAGGISAMTQVMVDHDAFLIFWLGGWAIGWVFAASTIAAQLFGAETIRVVSGDVEVRRGVGPAARTWRYRGAAVQNLTGFEPAHDMFGMRSMQTPLWMRPKTGAAKFDYGAESVFLASEVDAPEGREIVAWLAKRLPVGAMVS